MKRLLAALLTLLCLSALPSAALAADSLSVKVDLPYYHVWITDDSNADDRFTYRWSALTPGAPIPTGRTGSYWDWYQKGNTEGTLSLSFSFAQTGTYEYRLAAYVPQREAGYVYESRTYLLTVVVQENSGGKRWAEWYVLNEASGTKVDRLDLDPRYSKPLPSEPEVDPGPGKDPEQSTDPGSSSNPSSSSDPGSSSNPGSSSTDPGGNTSQDPGSDSRHDSSKDSESDHDDDKDKDTKKKTSRSQSKSKSGSGSGSGSTNGKSGSGGANGGAKTGDETRLESMASILCVSGLLLAYLIYEELRERRANMK